jgi:uncharacterized repeat protein (TIGR03803 family)
MANRRLHLKLFTWAFVSLMTLSASSSQTAKFKVLHAFAPGSDGENPYNGVVFDAAGNLYGTTIRGGTGYGTRCGTVFELVPSGSGWEERILYNFPACIGPTGPLAMNATGSLYGTTLGGGNSSCGCGTAYELTPTSDGWTQKIIHSFVGGTTDGQDPYSGLIEDSAGNLYGTTYLGGAHGDGTVFELKPKAGGGWEEKVLHHFNRQVDGSNPVAGLTLDAAGNLWGTSDQGGIHGLGAVFKLTPSGSNWILKTVYAFKTADRTSYLLTGVTPDAGILYGTTPFGGDRFKGDVFSLTPTGGGWNFSTVYSFTDGRDGTGPESALSIDKAGNLYGTTLSGGAHNLGTVYKLTLANGVWTKTKLHSFTGGNDGDGPTGNLVLDSSGNLYGTAEYGGVGGAGVVFEITP